MKTAIFSSKYFIIIGLLIFLCFTGLGLFMSSKFKKRTEQISTDMAAKVYQLKSNVIRNEFNGFIKGLASSDIVMPQIKNKKDFYKLKPVVEALLLSHPKINHGWYMIAAGGDTVYTVLQKSNKIYESGKPSTEQKKWVYAQVVKQDGAPRTGAVISIADSLHWLVANKHKLADSSTLILGLDINLKNLQRYLWSVDTTGRASAFIIDQNGYYITSPEENLIGTKMPDSIRESKERILLADSVTSYETVTSTYLQLPVIRFYTPLSIGGMNWTMVVDTPMLVVDEDIKVIEKYVMALFISTALIILVLIAWSQTKWQKEFMLRQALSLTTERQQKENALLQLDKLKEKVNPHFLFNSLSSLNGLIEEQPDLAKSFVIKLSRVYRYVLDPAPNGLAEVSEEVRFANEYFFLLKIRFGDALAPLKIDVSEQHMTRYIPFMSLQTLVENAVKHNIVSKSKPLHIRIQSVGDGLIVVNNLQLRNDVKDSGKQGLNYLQRTYAHFGDKQLKYGIEGDIYRCFLPLLKFEEV